MWTSTREIKCEHPHYECKLMITYVNKKYIISNIQLSAFQLPTITYKFKKWIDIKPLTKANMAP